MDPARVSVIRAVDGQDTGLSAQLAEKNRLHNRRWYQSLPCRPGFVVGSGGCGWPVHWFYHERRNFIYTSTERTGPGFSALKASAGRPAKRTRPLTSYPAGQSRVLPTKSRSWSRVFTDQEGRKCVLQNSRLLWLQSLLCRPGLVVGSGVLWTVKLLVKHRTKNANTDVISS